LGGFRTKTRWAGIATPLDTTFDARPFDWPWQVIQAIADRIIVKPAKLEMPRFDPKPFEIIWKV
jgi:sporulation protein YlmC with PRC-barrel domain